MNTVLNLLHRGENFMLAELPSLEAGVRFLISKSGDNVLLHRIAQDLPIISTSLPMQLIEAIYQAAHS